VAGHGDTGTAPAVVWFKRDLRLSDHAPLCEAIASGRPLLLIYCFEPSLLADPHYATRHWRFVTQSLRDMNRRLKPLGTRVHVFLSEMLPLLQALQHSGWVVARAAQLLGLQRTTLVEKMRKFELQRNQVSDS